MPIEGHAFISYVREDKEKVDRLEGILKGSGIPVWRDTEDLWPGEDWKLRIREAITQGAFAFLACFSEQSANKQVTYQNEELALATDEIRKRTPGTPWLIPILFDHVTLPSYDLGGGRTLDNIQRADLTANDWEIGAGRLVASVVRILGDDRAPSAAPAADVLEQLKKLLRDPAGDIVLEEDLVMPAANNARDLLADATRFPFEAAELGQGHVVAARYIADRAQDYRLAIDPLLRILVTGCAWGLPQHEGLWTRAMNRVANVGRERGGLTVLNTLADFPVVLIVYGAGLAAVSRRNLGSLRAIAVDAEVRTDSGRVPVIGRANVWAPFEGYDLPAQLLALTADDVDVTDEDIEALAEGRKGKRYTPVSNFLHHTLRPAFLGLIPDDEEYTETFDQLEVLLGLIATDASLQRQPGTGYVQPPSFGAFTWRDARFADDDQRLEVRVRRQFEESPGQWPPIQARLFGGNPDRAGAAFDRFDEQASRVRNTQW